MSKEKDLFSESIKEHLTDFEVPYNEGHWADMEQKLDQMPSGDMTGKTTSNVKYYVAAGVGAALIAGYFIIKPVESAMEDLPEVAKVEEQQTRTLQNDNIAPKEVAVEIEKEEAPIKAETAEQFEPEQSEDADKASVDEKADKYANYSEHQVKEEGKSFVEDIVEAQKAEFKDAPNLDNLELKSGIVVKTTGALCVGDPINFDVDRQHDQVKYYWNFGDNGLTSRKQDPAHTFKRAGTFEITLLISKGEKNDYKTVKTITIGEKPDVSMSWTNKLITLNDPYMDATAECSEKCNYTWLFNESQQMNGASASFLVPRKGYFPVEVTATSANGCVSKVNKTYRADKGVEIIVENSFTPGNGINNEEFLPKELKDADVEFTFFVEDLSGKRVFESHDKYNAWNGSLNNSGNTLPEGVYLWKLKFQDDRGRSHEQTGKINLIK